MRARLTRRSGNAKTGPIPVSITEEASCPVSCPLRERGCYARAFPLALHWRRVARAAGATWAQFLREVNALLSGQLWRHNQAGDLPGDGSAIDGQELGELVAVNERRHLRGFTYTHYPIGATGIAAQNLAVIRDANARGFTINISTNNREEAAAVRRDYPDLPVVTILPVDPGEAGDIVICPNHLNRAITCDLCELCSVADRGFVIGFPAHGRDRYEVERRTQI